MSDIIANTTEADAPETEEESEISPVAFTGRALPLFKLLLKNIVLTVLTLGIYRFWAKTWVRRYFWNNVSIAKEPFEYTGQPKELFMGFLIALAVLVPLGIVNYYATIFIASEPSLELPYTVAFYGSLFLLFQFAFYRLWRYRMTRTAWRGIHFGLNGSSFKFVLLSLMWTVISLLTLNLAAPWARTALARYRIDNSQFGDSDFSFHGSGKALIFPWLVAYGIPVTLMVIWGWMNVGQFSGDLLSAFLNPDKENIKVIAESMNNLNAVWLTWIVGIAFPLLLIWYKAREFRYFVNSTRLEDVTLTSEFSPGVVVGLYVLTYFLFIGLYVGGFAAVTTAIVSGMVVSGSFDKQIFFEIGEYVGFAFVFLLLVLIPLATQGFLRYQLVKRFFRRLSIDDVAKLETVAQSTSPAPSRGEGFADALDVGAI